VPGFATREVANDLSALMSASATKQMVTTFLPGFRFARGRTIRQVGRQRIHPPKFFMPAVLAILVSFDLCRMFKDERDGAVNPDHGTDRRRSVEDDPGSPAISEIVNHYVQADAMNEPKNGS
jgi:hypothetical protein